MQTDEVGESLLGEPLRPAGLSERLWRTTKNLTDPIQPAISTDVAAGGTLKVAFHFEVKAVQLLLMGLHTYE